jgi:hypothetical protein
VEASAKERRQKKPAPPPKYAPGDVVHTKVTVRVKMFSKLRPDGTSLTKYLSLIRGADWVVLSSHVPEGKRAWRYRLRCKPYEVERPERSLIPTGRKVRA